MKTDFYCLVFYFCYVLAPKTWYLKRYSNKKYDHISYHQPRGTKPGTFLPRFFSACCISDISTVPVQDIFVQFRHDVIHSADVFELSCLDVQSIYYSGCLTHWETLHLCCAPVSLCLSFTATQSCWKKMQSAFSLCSLGLPSYWHTNTATVSATWFSLRYFTHSAVVSYQYNYKTIGKRVKRLSAYMGSDYEFARLLCGTKKEHFWYQKMFLAINLPLGLLNRHSTTNRRGQDKYQHWLCHRKQPNSVLIWGTQNATHRFFVYFFLLHSHS